MMLENVPRIRVVAAVIEDHGRFLITQRRSNGILGGLWEFPSGKVEEGESDEKALRRELLERVGAEVKVGKVKAQRTHRYEGYVVDLVLYQAELAEGSIPKPHRVADLCWVLPGDLEKYPFPAADQRTTDLLLGMPRKEYVNRLQLVPAMVA
jgi:8-oxo-dGTP diphosphatase